MSEESIVLKNPKGIPYREERNMKNWHFFNADKNFKRMFVAIVTRVLIM